MEVREEEKDEFEGFFAAFQMERMLSGIGS